MEDEKVFIELCKKLLAKKLNWPEEKQLKQRDFEYLSTEIFRLTKIELSTATLRRIWSNNYKSLPQVHTLNAMAQYLGHTNWHDFKTEQTAPAPIDQKKKRPKQKAPIAIALMAVLTLLAVIIISQSGSSPRPATSLSISQPPSGTVPATVGFHYDISQATEPISIELSWNPFERTVLNPADSFYTGVYYYPDYHRTKLLRGKEVLTDIPVYVTTPDWHALVMKKDNDIHPTYIEAQDFLTGGQMGFDMETLSPYLLNEPELVHSVFTFSNPVLEQFQADEVRLQTRIKHNPHKSDPACTRAILLLKAKNGRASIPIMEKGCYGNYGIGFSEKVISGKTNDLSPLAADLSEYVDVQINIKGKEVSIQVADNPVYSFTYEKALGTLKVAKLMINGLGSVDSFAVMDDEDSYQEDFSAYQVP
ncbi:MAG: hypothetical protein HEP71_30105 [Roseivirga sp.]|nr:hypothetical protein [Roseivirga sp.]